MCVCLFLVELIMQKYKTVHHSSNDSNGLKVLDYCVKKKTDAINNSINTWVTLARSSGSTH